ncbi:MAG TPA: nucleoside 2-deoxyribosyltransferase, partial [Methanoregulaceae archaeon]|nr:nucleoside 2-deoxyribosyltransferase [Methanoregulaceae archaeon]
TEIESADVLVAVIDGADADSGTAWEMGYAAGRGIPVVALRTDFRRVGAHERVNLMLECSSPVAGSFGELAALLGDEGEREEKKDYQASGKAMLV